MRGSRRLLVLALAALALDYALWFHADKHLAAVLLVFVLPPLLLLPGVALDNAKAAFWAGVFGLFWFSHGVMVAWSRPAEAAFAWTALLLALVIVVSSSWPGLAGRFAGKRRR
ncbi:membrane protein [Pseudoxanthomonas dokdonensis]|uniref:Membrane protein n=1 Tax=Pseudoxanthomonas dokdonensis TaxID=344882 RepID=A0A0R0CM56_9GAMM|nr:membrane protein [Pseudoxanthomonas dokdonensis]